MARHLTDQEQIEIVTAYEAGVTGPKLAAKYGKQVETIYAVLHKAGVVKCRMRTTKNGKRRCRLCRKWRVFEKFPEVSTRPDMQYRGYECSDCIRDEQHRRAYWMKGNTGLTLAQYNELLAAQNGGCAMCGKPPVRIRLSVDHDHVTCVIRGLLCHGCNTKLAGFEDFEQRRKMESYIASPPAAGRGWQFRNSRILSSRLFPAFRVGMAPE